MSTPTVPYRSPMNVIASLYWFCHGHLIAAAVGAIISAVLGWHILATSLAIQFLVFGNLWFFQQRSHLRRMDECDARHEAHLRWMAEHAR